MYLKCKFNTENNTMKSLKYFWQIDQQKVNILTKYKKLTKA